MRYIKRPLTTHRRRAASRIELKRRVNSAKAASVPVSRWRGETPTTRRVCAHAFRYWLIGILKGGYGNDVYPGAGLQDNRWFASVGAVYKLTREWQLNATVRQDWQIATQPTFTYNATSVLLGMRVQR